MQFYKFKRTIYMFGRKLAITTMCNSSLKTLVSMSVKCLSVYTLSYTCTYTHSLFLCHSNLFHVLFFLRHCCTCWQEPAISQNALLDIVPGNTIHHQLGGLPLLHQVLNTMWKINQDKNADAHDLICLQIFFYAAEWVLSSL